MDFLSHGEKLSRQEAKHKAKGYSNLLPLLLAIALHRRLTT